MTKSILYVLGAVFIIVGLIGFINHPVLGIFEVNTLHNLIHLVSGILALVFAGMGDASAKKFAVVLGVVYALVTILGFVLTDGNIFGLIMANMADNLLHLVLAVVLLAVGLGGRSHSATMPSNSAM